MDKWLSHPTALKIISVLLGILLFAVVHIDPETSPQSITSSIDTKIIEAATIVPIGLDEEKYVLTAMEPTVARLVVEGKISNLRAATNADYVVNIDLSGVTKPGLQELPLTIKLPRGIKEVELSPRRVMVQIEEIVTKTFDAQVMIEGDHAAGFVLGEPEIMSEGGRAVQVTLPRDDMDKVGLVAASLDVSGSDKTVVNKKAKLVVYDKEGQEIPNAIVQPSTLHVEVKVTLPFKQVPLQLRYSGELTEGMSLVSVKPSVDFVTVYAPQEELDAISIYDGAVLDLTKVKQSGTIKVKAPPVDHIQAVNPGEIDLDIVVEVATTRKLSNVPITITGTEPGLTTQIITPASGTLDLEISGAEAVLADVALDDVAIVAKVAGLEPGTHTVALELELPPYVQPVLADGQSLSATIEIIDTTASNGGEEPEDIEVGGTPTNPPEEGQEGGSPGNNGSGAGNANARSGGADTDIQYALVDAKRRSPSNTLILWEKEGATI
ncbi:YbbR-like domain-containing protein [Paenibacillus sp. NPDC057967]|uniref:CdaR family protein n=1 Tax=Paenibacillus sp. NPDC057967 TaxID=3346293 RepID=UPI0036D84AA5